MLNHPNIAAIYGLEEGGGVSALVMELVEGDDLSQRIARGAIQIDEALPIAKQIADALEAAHEQGIIHRDLKPANIKVRSDGMVKVLDFGLAKAMEPVGAMSASNSMSPTVTTPAMTQAGMILGTAAYMSPEQARGRHVDKRTDVWAFGCVMFEMLSGKRAFPGDDVTETVAAILRGEPDWAALPANMPSAVVRLLRRSLAKERRERLPDIAVARLDIQDALTMPAPSVSAVQRWARWIVPVAVAAGIVFGAMATELWRQQQHSAPVAVVAGPLTRTAIELPENAQLALGTVIPDEGFDSPALAVSPDGRRVAYVGRSSSGTLVYVRDMTGLDVHAVAGTGGAIYAFFSPDGRSLGFLTNDKVKKVPLDGGAPTTLCDAVIPLNATWAGDQIYFSENEGGRLSRIAVAGGKAAVVIPGGRGRFSQVLPDGQSALFTRTAGGISADYAEIGLVSLTTGELKKVLVQSGYDGRYFPSGHLLFGRAGSLFAVRFDPIRQEVLGDAVQVVAGVSMESLFGQVHAAASTNGLIAYVPGGERALGRLAWVDRQGHTDYLPAPTRVYGVLDLSPDGSRVGVHVADVTDYIWTYDIARGEGRKLTLTAGEHSGWPVWSPDNRMFVFEAWRSDGQGRLLLRAADGGGSVTEILPGSGRRSVTPFSWSPDGRVLAVTGIAGGFFDLRDHAKRIGESVGSMPHFSPDGRWIAYGVGDAGRSDIFIRSYPDGKMTRQFSPDGGIEPVWCACGELFYRKGNQWMSSRVQTDPELHWDPPKLAFQTDFIDTPGRSYDVSPGKRLLVVKQAEPDVRSRIGIVTNWLEQLNQRAPMK